MPVVYSVDEVMSDLFGLEDVSDFLEGWYVWTRGSADFTCYILLLFLCIFWGLDRKTKC